MAIPLLANAYMRIATRVLLAVLVPWLLTAQSPTPQRAVLVTGASSGIGRKITERLASKGLFVYAGARAQRDLDELNAIKNVQAVRLDVTVPADIASAVATVTKAGRGLHGVVNNAGVVVVAPLIEADEKDLDFIFDVNVYGPYRITKAFAPLLLESKGRVVNISSLNGIVASPMIGAYSMSKHAIEAYGDGLSAELARFGVKVSLIEPGNYGTEIGRNLLARMDTSIVKGSRFEPQMRSTINAMRGFENNPPPDDVADAVLDALTSPTPKMRYLVVPVANQGAVAIRKVIDQLVQLNEGHKFSYDRDALVLMLDEALARAKQTTTPPRRAHHALVYDEALKRVVLTAGSTPVDGGQRFEFFNDLWTFDGVRWTSRPASGTKLSGIQLAYDTKRNRVMSFGGYADGQSLGDLRVLETAGWLTLGAHPEVRAAEPGFVYDSKRDRFITFGGSAGRGQAHGTTWEFDGTTWTKSAATGPAARQGHMMVYDAQRGRTVVFGGSGTGAPGQPSPRFGDTWESDGARWTQRQVTGPTPRVSAGATYDSKRGRVILFGGLDSAGFSGETWAWDGSAWTKLSSTGPEPRAMGYLAYDKQRDRIVLFGGRKGYPDGDLADTWEFDGTAWRRIQ